MLQAWIRSLQQHFKVYYSLRWQESSLEHSWGRAGKERRACNSISGIWIYLHQKSRCEMLIGGDDISNDVITLGTCALVSTLHWLAEIWQLSQREATGRLEVEFKFQRRSCKLSFHFPPHCQSAPESLLAGFYCLSSYFWFHGPWCFSWISKQRAYQILKLQGKGLQEIVIINNW